MVYGSASFVDLRNGRLVILEHAGAQIETKTVRNFAAAREQRQTGLDGIGLAFKIPSLFILTRLLNTKKCRIPIFSGYPGEGDLSCKEVSHLCCRTILYYIYCT